MVIPERPADVGPDENEEPAPATKKIDMEADISQLEAPTFTTITRGPPKPMLSLSWDHPVNLIGEKVLNPIIHTCEKCERPIMIYGRMIPCRHVFCLACAQTPHPPPTCPRCGEVVTRVEPTGLGTVFMCTHGGSRHGREGCKRTYLSQRDLMAHINHRHAPGGALQGQPLPPPPKPLPPNPPLHSPKSLTPSMSPIARKPNTHMHDPRMQPSEPPTNMEIPTAPHMGGFPPHIPSMGIIPPHDNNFSPAAQPPFNPYLTPPVPPFPPQHTAPPFFSPPVGAGPPGPGAQPPQWNMPSGNAAPTQTGGFFHR